MNFSDPERRRKYDNHGITEDTPNFRKSNEDIYASYGRFDHDFHDTFHEFFGSSGGFRFGFNNGRGSSDQNERRIFHKQSITSKAYYSTVLKNSKKQPNLILFYSDWCFTCLRIEPIWTKLSEELEPVGFGISTVHSEHEKELARKISVRELPHLVLLLDGRTFHYKETQFSAIKAIEWIRRKLPYKMIQAVDDSNIDSFLSGWMDNKVRVLIFGKLDIIRLRYLTTAYRFRERVLFGFVQLNDRNARKVLQQFRISPNNKEVDTILLFNEDHSSPIASVSMKDIPLKTMQELIENNQFLQLPRLSSQSVFDILCPPGASKPRQRLCVVLVNQDSSNEEEGRRQAMREFIIDHKFSKDRVRFVYVLKEKQSEFVNALVAGSNDEKRNVAIVWRTEESNIRYEWLNTEWPSAFSNDQEQQEKLNETRQTLKKTLQNLLVGGDVLSHEAIVKELFDEHATSIFVRIANRMLEAIEVIRENVTKEELLPALSLVVTVGFILIGGYVMNYLVKMEEESVRKQLGAKGMKVDKKGKVVPELKIHELRAETYNGMIRLLKPGCRTIVLIVDRESKEKLVPKFYKLAWPYRRNKTLMFGFLYIEKGKYFV